MPYNTTLLRPPVTVVVEGCVEASPLETYTSMVHIYSTVQAGRQAGGRGKRARLVGREVMQCLGCLRGLPAYKTREPSAASMHLAEQFFFFVSFLVPSLGTSSSKVYKILLASLASSFPSSLQGGMMCTRW